MLTRQEALERLERFGPNELPGSRARTPLRLLLEVLREPMVLLLVAGGTLYLALGDVQDAASLLVFLVLIVGITLVQSHRTEQALTRLRDLSSPRALVVRDSEKFRIPGREVVPGDQLVLAEGDRVPADARILDCSHLAADESLLTGESAPVEKGRTQSVFAGTTLVRGQGLAEVTATGLGTELGKIGRSLAEPLEAPSPLQRSARRLVRHFALIALAICVAILVTYAWTRGDWLGGVLAGVTLAMAILPNELPAVLLVFLAGGAWRLAQHRVLARKIPAVEALGSITHLCVDKTGTLTLNRMALQQLWNGQASWDLGAPIPLPLPDGFHELLEFGILASRPDPFDPMEQAFHTDGQRALAGTDHLHPDWSLIHEYPLSDSLLAVSHVWHPGDPGQPQSQPQFQPLVGATKGAPEAICELCRLPPEASQKILAQASAMASTGLRVLGVARASAKHPLPEKVQGLPCQFLGLIGLADPVRPDVPAAIAECHAAGIRVLMLTGDHPDTARSIARQVGLPFPDEVLTGAELQILPDTELDAQLERIHVYSRMKPDQKLRLVEHLKGAGHVVAMTGDGVNDAPALRRADVGVAMGRRGTDVAREAAALVLLDDDFSSIVAAIRLGRRVYANLSRALSYLLAVHLPITALSIIPVAFRLPLVLLPLHIALLHLVIEPACTLVFEAEPGDASLMRMPPRAPGKPLFEGPTLRASLIQGAWASVAVLGVYGVAHARGQGEADTRALAFTTLMVANLGLIRSARAERTANPVFRWVLASSLILLGAALYVPGLRDLLRFSHLHPLDLAICLGAGWLTTRLAPGN